MSCSHARAAYTCQHLAPGYNPRASCAGRTVVLCFSIAIACRMYQIQVSNPTHSLDVAPARVCHSSGTIRALQQQQEAEEAGDGQQDSLNESSVGQQ